MLTVTKAKNSNNFLICWWSLVKLALKCSVCKYLEYQTYIIFWVFPFNDFPKYDLVFWTQMHMNFVHITPSFRTHMAEGTVYTQIGCRISNCLPIIQPFSHINKGKYGRTKCSWCMVKWNIVWSFSVCADLFSFRIFTIDTIPHGLFVLCILWVSLSVKVPSYKISGFTSCCAHTYHHKCLCSPFIHSVVCNDSVSGLRRPWSDHYENTPIQIYRKFHLQNLKIFR